MHQGKIVQESENSNAALFSAPEDDVFARVAHRYDLLCDLFSLGIHRIWKRRVAAIVSQERWETLFDAGTGTGDIALRVLRSEPENSTRHIHASDLCPNMLAIAKKRLKQSNACVSFKIRNAEDLFSVDCESYDAYSMSLVLKICNRDKALREAFRILKPNGRLIVLEASNIRWRWLQSLYIRYMKLCMPVVGWVATGGDSSAYQYLLKGIEGFPTAEGLENELKDLGYVDVGFERLSLGIVAVHTARKPGPLNV